MNKKKKDLARELNVSEVTIWRWERAGILDRKINEIEERNKKVLGSQEEVLQSLTNVIKSNTDIMRDITNEIQRNSEILQDITNVLQGITSKIEDTSDLIQKNHNLLQEIANVIQTIMKSQEMKHNVLQPLVDKKANVMQSNTSEIEENFTATKLAKVLGVNRSTTQRWITKGEIKATKTVTGYVIPKEEAIRVIFKKVYEDLNVTHHFGDSVPVPIFKDEVKKHVAISDEEIDKALLDLDSKEIIYLQTLDNPGDFSDSDRGIKFQGRILYFITWTKR
jgi:excisionase family DNA binding protein